MRSNTEHNQNMVIMISHRKQALEQGKQIVSMNDGQIESYGTYNELAIDGKYSDLFVNI